MSTTSPWLLFLHQLPAQPSTRRVHVWRRLRSYGAVNLQYSVWLLPDTPKLRERLTELCHEIEGGSGNARLLPIQFPESQRDEEMKELFRKQSRQAYGEVLLACRALTAELRTRHMAKPLDAIELAGLSDAIGRIEGRLHKIRARDFFGTGLHAQTASAVLECRRALAVASDNRGHAAVSYRGDRLR